MRRKMELFGSALGNTKKTEAPKEELDKATRRGVLRVLAGFGGAAVVAGTVKELFDTDTPTQDVLNEEELSRIPLEVKERLTIMADSPLFMERLEEYIKKYRGDELALALHPENGRARTIGDDAGRSRIDYVREEVMRGANAIPPDIRQELSFYVTGMFAEESKYRNDLESGVGAQFIAQAMPETYTLYGYTQADMKKLKIQVEFTRRLLTDSYNIITKDARKALSKIQELYFNDEAAFRTTFLSLCLVNAYQTGIGNMISVVQEFAKKPRRNLQGYDVFEAMTRAAEDGSFDPHYKEQSAHYPKKSAAFAFLLSASDTSAA